MDASNISPWSVMAMILLGLTDLLKHGISPKVSITCHTISKTQMFKWCFLHASNISVSYGNLRSAITTISLGLACLPKYVMSSKVSGTRHCLHEAQNSKIMLQYLVPCLLGLPLLQAHSSIRVWHFFTQMCLSIRITDHTRAAVSLENHIWFPLCPSFLQALFSMGSKHSTQVTDIIGFYPVRNVKTQLTYIGREIY